MIILYNLIYTVFFLAYFPFLILRRKFHKDFLTRFGNFPANLKSQIKAGKNLWIHAVSVGEVLVICGLITELKKQFPRYQIVCSTVTLTGFKLAQEKLKDQAIVIYAPLDWSWVVKKYIQLIKPEIYIAAETEIWPGLYRSLKASRVPVAIVNGRISDTAFKGYQKIGFFIKRILADVSVFCMQTKTDAQRMIQLGADSSKVQVLGNLKFDIRPAQDLGFLERSGFSAKHLGGPATLCGGEPEDLVVIGGSTHPGEEEILLEVFSSLREKFTRLRLIIAPRHVERSSQIIQGIESRGLEVKRFSQFLARAKNCAKTIIVVDTIGQLRSLYSLATIVFVGKTLVGRGGQNVIEPASLGKAIIVGPHTENFKDVVQIFLESKALVQVESIDEFYREVENLLQNPQRREQLGQAAKAVVEKNKGATQRTVEILREWL